MPRNNGNKLMACPHCDLVLKRKYEHFSFKLECPRCKSQLSNGWYVRDGALFLLVLAAAVLYFPANFLPMFSIERLGEVRMSSVFSGIQHLFYSGQWFTALVVWFCSMLVPGLIISILAYTLICLRWFKPKRYNQKLFRVFCHIGEWAMLDIYLLSFGVALFKLNDLGIVTAHWGLAAFIGLVLVTVDILAQTNRACIWRRLAH